MAKIAIPIHIGILLFCLCSNNVIVSAMIIENPANMASSGPISEALGLTKSGRDKREVGVDGSNKGFEDFDKFYKKLFPHCVLESVKITKVYSIDKVDEWPKDRQKIKSDAFDVTNENDYAMESQSHSFQYKKTNGETVSVSNTIGLSGKIELPGLSSLIPTIQFSNQETTTKSENIEETMTYPSQKVNLGPRSKVKVSWSLYRNQTVEKYHVSFKAEPVLKLHPIFSFGLALGGIVTSPIDLCFNNLKELNELKFQNSDNVEINPETKDLIFKNFVVLKTVHHDDFVVVFGKEEPIN